MANILVIDDDAQVCETMGRIVARMGHDSTTATTLGDGLSRLEAGAFDLVFLDVRLPDGNGLTALPQIISNRAAPEVVILTGQGDPDGAELAIQAGVWDYLVKPTPLKDTMLIVERALKYRREKLAAKAPPALDLSDMFGGGSAMRACFDLLAQASRSLTPVLITGETGTGKELFARKVHENSQRAPGPFVTVDCAALTENLVESILFGHKKGAFTGADRDSQGLIRLANGGTLFLDEIGELPPVTQKAFLRVLQEKRFRPVGEASEVESDFRLVAATNRDLPAMVEVGTFRSDLYFRIKAIHIELPPLRLRAEDIGPLATFQVERLCHKYGLPLKGFDPEFFAVLQAYAWPGNVRELFGVLESAVSAVGQGEVLYSRHLPSDVRIAVARAALRRGQPAETEAWAAPLPPGADIQAGAPLQDDADNPTMKDFKAAMEKTYLEKLLRQTGKDVDAMISASGLSKSHLYALLKKYGLSLKGAV